MRRLFPLLALVVVLMLGVARSPFTSTVHAQDATPSGGPSQEEEGVTFTPLGFAAGIIPVDGNLARRERAQQQAGGKCPQISHAVVPLG